MGTSLLGTEPSRYKNTRNAYGGKKGKRKEEEKEISHGQKRRESPGWPIFSNSLIAEEESLIW